jgi:GxxExxY protein
VHTEPGRVYSKAPTPRVCNTNCSRLDFDLPLNLGLPVVYRGVKFDLGYRMDLVVEDLVVVEIKSVDGISPVHQAQILSYLKLSGKCIGLLINFNVVHLRDGIERFVNGTGWK